MAERMESLEPGSGRLRAARQRLSVPGELLLALLPTLAVLAVLALVEALTSQRLLFASLASSAFLIYLDPQHGMNSIRTLLISQLLAAGIGSAGLLIFGPGYAVAGTAMVLLMVLMIALDAMHPPAVASVLGFALRAKDVDNLLIFLLALGVTAALVVLQRATTWLLARMQRV